MYEIEKGSEEAARMRFESAARIVRDTLDKQRILPANTETDNIAIAMMVNKVFESVVAVRTI